MNAIKGIGIAFLCFILFVAVAVLGTVVWANSTVLDKEFVKKQVGKVDISEIAREVVDEWVDIELPDDFAMAEGVIDDLLVDVLDQYEDWIKEQIDAGIDAGYDYLKGDTDDLEITIDMRELKSTLHEKLWAIYQEQASVLLPRFFDGVVDHLIENPGDVVDMIPEEFLPAEARYLTEQQLVDYIEQYPEEIRAQVDSIGTDAVLDSLSNDVVRPFFDEFIDEFITQIDDTYEVDEELIQEEGMDALEMVQKGYSYYKIGYYALIALIVILLAGIFLIHRDLKVSALAVGITLGFYGLLQVAGTIIAKSIDPLKYATEEIPAVLQELALSIYQDSLMPILWFNIAVLVVGVALIIVALVIRRRSPHGPELQ